MIHTRPLTIDPQKAVYPVEVLTCIKTKEMNITEVFENRMLGYNRFKSRRDRFLNLSDGTEFHNIIHLRRIGQEVNSRPYGYRSVWCKMKIVLLRF